MDLELVQVLLDYQGFGPLEAHGVYGPATEAAKRAYQSSIGEPVTGSVDQQLFDMLGAGAEPGLAVCGPYDNSTEYAVRISIGQPRSIVCGDVASDLYFSSVTLTGDFWSDPNTFAANLPHC